MANWRKTKSPGVYVAHQRCCPAFAHDDAPLPMRAVLARPRMEPVDEADGMAEAVAKDRDEVLSWLAAARKAAPHLKELAAAVKNKPFLVVVE